MTIEPDDLLSRCIIYDKAFERNMHVDARLVVFEASAADGACHVSGVLRRLAPADVDVHRIGCGVAFLQNGRKKPPPLPGRGRKYYCGFRTARVGELPLNGDGYSLRLTLDCENGEPAHVDIALLVFEDNKSARAAIKADAGLAIADAFGPAVEYVCSNDHGDNHHPLIKFPGCLSGVGSGRSLLQTLQ